MRKTTHKQHLWRLCVARLMSVDKELQVVVGRYRRERCHIVAFSENLGHSRLGCGTLVPFQFKGIDLSVAVLDIVNLLLLSSAPEIGFRMAVCVVIGFYALADEEILPQCTHILAKVERRKILQDGIANAVVVEIDFLTALQLGADVAIVGTELENHKAL